MIEIEVVRKGNPRNHLTIAKDRVTLKLAPDVDGPTEAWLTEFARRIAQKHQPTLVHTLRATFRTSGILSISLAPGSLKRGGKYVRCPSFEFGMPKLEKKP